MLVPSHAVAVCARLDRLDSSPDCAPLHSSGNVADGCHWACTPRDSRYTFSKSIDNASGAGGGAASNGIIDRSSATDTAVIQGNQLDPRSNRGVSDFDRPQRFIAAFTWDLPQPHFAAHSSLATWLLANWQVSAIVTLMSGLPIDIVDPQGGNLYGQTGARPNWAPGANGTRQ
jgi:hypothetical protein